MKNVDPDGLKKKKMNRGWKWEAEEKIGRREEADGIGIVGGLSTFESLGSMDSTRAERSFV